MKKIIFTLIMVVCSFVLMTTNAYAAEDDWQSGGDGYVYFKLPSQQPSSGTKFTITVNPDETLEVFDYGLGIYVPISDKQIEIRFVESFGNLDMYYKYGTKDFTALSIANYPLFLSHDESPVRKLGDIDDIPVDNFDTIEDLPQTVKTNNPQIDDFGTVLFTVSGQDVLVRIIYYEEYLLKYTMDANTDLSLFDTIEALYLNADGNTPQIFINNGENQYLADMLGDEPKAFTPHTIWDLNTNDLNVVNNYKAHAFIKQNNEGVLIAYYYTDAFVMDHILSATLTYTSRTHKVNWFGLENVYSEWKRNVFDYTSEDYLDYRNMTSDWQLWIPGWNLIAAGIRTSTYYQMPRIDVVSFPNTQAEYNVTLSEINGHFSTRTPGFEDIMDNSNYKLFAFALEEGRAVDMGVIGKVQTEFYYDETNPENPDNLKIMQIIYRTDGKVYTTVGDDMDLEVIPDDPILPTEPKDKSNIIVLIIIVSIIIGFAYGAFKFRALKSVKAFTNYVIVFALFLGIIYLIYFLWQNGYLNDILFAWF